MSKLSGRLLKDSRFNPLAPGWYFLTPRAMAKSGDLSIDRNVKLCFHYLGSLETPHSLVLDLGGLLLAWVFSV